MSMDSERAKMSALERGIDERDEQIRKLQEKVARYTDEMEQSSALIEDLRAQLNKGTHLSWYTCLYTTADCTYISSYLLGMVFCLCEICLAEIAPQACEWFNQSAISLRMAGLWYYKLILISFCDEALFCYMIICLLLAEFSGPGATDVHIRKIKELQGTLKDTTQQSKYTEERLETVS